MFDWSGLELGRGETESGVDNTKARTREARHRQLSNCPTQAKTGLEWSTPPDVHASHLVITAHFATGDWLASAACIRFSTAIASG